MKENIKPTFFALPLGISDLKFKNKSSTIIMLGRLYCLWYKRKQIIRIRKKTLKDTLFWLSDLSITRALQELEAQNIIVIDHNVYKEYRLYEINFTDFFKNKIANYSEEKSEVVEYDNEDTEEQAEEAEEFDVENFNAKENKKPKNADYNHDDDYLPVEGWANTDRQDFRCLLRKYDGKVPEIPEEVLNFNFGNFCDDDFKTYIIDKDKMVYFKPDDMLDRTPVFTDENGVGMSLNYFLELRPQGKLDLMTYLDIYTSLTDEYNHLKNNGKI